MRALLLLLSALILLEPTDGVQYDALAEHDRNIVNEAIKKANEKHGQDKHLDFFTILRPNSKTLNVILKPTSCDGKTKKVHLQTCNIQDRAKPQVSCVACHKTMACFRLRETDKILKAINACASEPSVHLTGGGTLLLQKGKAEGEIGCLGCI